MRGELVWGGEERMVMIVELIAATQSSFTEGPLPSMKECSGFKVEQLLSILI
jgi:hypothetical protein